MASAPVSPFATLYCPIQNEIKIGHVLFPLVHVSLLRFEPAHGKISVFFFYVSIIFTTFAFLSKFYHVRRNTETAIY